MPMTVTKKEACGGRYNPMLGEMLGEAGSFPLKFKKFNYILGSVWWSQGESNP